MKTSETIDKLAPALSKAQGEMKPAAQSSNNSHFKSDYSNLTDIFEALKEPLLNNGLCVLQEATTSDFGVSVTTRIMHTSGQWIEFGPLSVPLGRKDAHGIGSATSYAKRYSVSAALGVTSGEIDDDGNQAVKNAKPVIQKLSGQELNFVKNAIGNDQIVMNKVLAAYGVSNLSDIPATCFADLKSRLQPVSNQSVTI